MYSLIIMIIVIIIMIMITDIARPINYDYSVYRYWVTSLFGLVRG